MAEFTLKFAPIVVLLFLGSVSLLGFSFVVLLYGTVRRSPLFAKLGGGAALTIGIGYFILFAGVSFGSSKNLFPPADLKYFFQINVPLVYSLSSVNSAVS